MRNNNQRPNIVILILDAVRARNLSMYGYPVTTTHHLDAFAADSVLFKRAFAPATWTIPTHASLLSGLYLSQHRIETVKGDRRFHEAIVPLPYALRKGGYRTAAFSSNVLFGPQQYFGGGFDEFHEVDQLMESRAATKFIQMLAEHPRGLGRRAVRYARKTMTPRLLLESVSLWFTKLDNRQDPLFTVINLANAHYPWAVPLDLLWKNLRFHPKYLLQQDFITLNPFAFNSGRRQISETHRRVWQYLYNAALMHVDREVGRFLERIRQRENTVIAITADHGEMLGDYRNIVGHTLTLHDNVIHVPLIVHHPEYPSGSIVEGVVQNLDLYSSALEWAGVSPGSVPSAQTQRPSLSRAVENPQALGGYAFAEEDYTDSYNLLVGLRRVNPAMDAKAYPRRQVVIRSATHKYVWCDDHIGELYDLASDPGELRNLINTNHPREKAVLKDLQVRLKSWQNSLEIFPPRSVSVEAKRDSIMVDRLKSLGYLA